LQQENLINIQILGPSKRNARVIKLFEQRGDVVSAREDLPTKGDADYLISNWFTPIFKKSLIREYTGRIINIHNAYCPYGRGIYPNLWCSRDGYPIGVTVHLIDKGIDTGPILAHREISWSEDDTLETMYKRLCDASENLFFSIWDDFFAGKITATPQSNTDIYHSQTKSEKLLATLPMRWDTPISYLK
jgi:methionyl-tRNA formyltransferase